MSQRMKQVMLRKGDDRAVVWLPMRSEIHPGAQLTMSGDNYAELWTVDTVYVTQQDQDALHRQQHWNNNI